MWSYQTRRQLIGATLLSFLMALQNVTLSWYVAKWGGAGCWQVSCIVSSVLGHFKPSSLPCYPSSCTPFFLMMQVPLLFSHGKMFLRLPNLLPYLDFISLSNLSPHCHCYDIVSFLSSSLHFGPVNLLSNVMSLSFQFICLHSPFALSCKIIPSIFCSAIFCSCSFHLLALSFGAQCLSFLCWHY